MPVFDVSDFVELLSLQNKREIQIEEADITSQSTQSTLGKFIENKQSEDFQKEVESKYKKEDLPPDYFFSALAEIVLL